MRQKRSRRMVSMLLSLCLIIAFLPTTAFVTGSNTGKSIQLGTSGISAPTEVTDEKGTYYEPNSYIYFGVNSKKDDTPIKWRVLDAEKANDGSTSGMFLLSEYLLDSDLYFHTYPDNIITGYITYQGSDAQAWCIDFASDPSNFSSGEQGAMLGIAKTDSAEDDLFGFSCAEGTLAENDKLFFLSMREVADYLGNYEKAPSLLYENYSHEGCEWWLRTCKNGYSYTDAICVDRWGELWHNLVNYYQYNARPAFNLELSSVLFTSAARQGKEGTLGEFSPISDYSDNEWEITLRDDSRCFSVEEATASGSAGGTITLNYSGAATGSNEYVSVIIEKDGDLTHYGRIMEATSATGTVDIPIPADLADGEYTLHVFSEQYNGAYKTDFASEFSSVTLAVDSLPTLTAGTADRTSGTNATVTFKSNKAGSYYYAVVESGEAVPTIDTTGTAPSCSTTELTISLNGLTGESAKDIYIVVKDANGNESEKLKMTIPAYVEPVYSISVTPTRLDFGSAFIGYTAPAAKTVTVRNTGNQKLKLTPVAATNFEIGTLSKKHLAPNETATFTVQPKPGLVAGSYKETSIISCENYGMLLSFFFKVEAPTYTLTVDLNGGSGNTTGGEYIEGATIDIDAGSRSDHRFAGWTSSNGGSFSDASATSTTFTMPAVDTTITANWQYTGGTSGTGSASSATTYYSLTFDTNGGDELASIRKAEDTTIDLADYIPTREGYEFTGWYPDKNLTTKITVIYLSRNTTIYAGWKEVKEYPSTESTPFTDIKEADWFYEHIKFVYENGLMTGISGTTSEPYSNTNRAQTAVIFYRMEGCPTVKGKSSFTDVKRASGTAWYYDAVTWAQQNGIVEGYGNGKFGPNDSATREQLSAIFYRYANYKVYDVSAKGKLDCFTDKDSISEWAQEAVKWAVGNGIISGRGSKLFAPQGTATRAELAAMLHRFR